MLDLDGRHVKYLDRFQTSQPRPRPPFSYVAGRERLNTATPHRRKYRKKERETEKQVSHAGINEMDLAPFEFGHRNPLHLHVDIALKGLQCQQF